ncbi:NCS1 family nucleobase:cation symporter-1 [soil metagenome]
MSTHPSTEAALPDDFLGNHDLAPVPQDRRRWNMWNIGALWVGMAVCITTYNLSAGMISLGMTWSQAVLTVALGNLIVCIPMVLNAHPGTKYGIPFPVLVRASFGTWGANIPALMRAMVACGWFGIQTWIGGSAIYQLFAVIFHFDVATSADALPVLGISAGQFGCFMLFWVINVFFVLTGTESIRWLEDLAAPFLIAVGLLLMFWAVSKAGGWGAVLSASTTDKLRGPETLPFSRLFFPSLTAIVGYWATLSLNIPDFSRYAKSQKDQILGQFMGLPTTMVLYSFIGIVVTCASVLIYGKAIWDPVELLAKFDNVYIMGFALIALTIATLTTNIAANVVSPANDFSNVAPRLISFRTGGLITAVIGILIMPWRLISDLGSYIFTWLIGYSALLGSIAGVMLADYYIIRKKQLDVAELYRAGGKYSYCNGINWRAIIAMLIGIAPNVIGFTRAAATGSTPKNPDIFDTIYTYAWFVSLAVAAIVYVVITPKDPNSHGALT